MKGSSGPSLAEHPVPLVIRLAGLWTAAMFCYAYGDLISFYMPGRIAATARGDLGPLGVATQPMLLGIAAFMAIPALMIPLSLLFRPRLNRAVNILFGSLYTLAIAATVPFAPPFYMLLGAIEMGLTGAIAWQAWRWPAAPDVPPAGRG
jgi:hypothetical protein